MKFSWIYDSNDLRLKFLRRNFVMYIEYCVRMILYGDSYFSLGKRNIDEKKKQMEWSSEKNDVPSMSRKKGGKKSRE